MENKEKILIKTGKFHYALRRAIDLDIIRYINKNISVSQASTITFINDKASKGMVFQKDIEKEFGLKASSVSLMLNNMTKINLIKRSSVKEDARLKKIELTEKGLQLSNLILERTTIMQNKLVQGITEEELNNFLLVLDKFQNNLL